MGPTHRMLGALCGAVAATAADASPTVVGLTAVAASATAAGGTSPDMDQTETWRRTVGRLPRRFGGAWTGHRKVTHWWGWPPLVWWLVIPVLPEQVEWAATAMLVGWVSHLLGDVVFGALPVFPWGGRFVGLKVDTGGFAETGRARVWGRERTLLPFGPTRLLIGGALAWVLLGDHGRSVVGGWAATVLGQ